MIECNAIKLKQNSDKIKIMIIFAYLDNCNSDCN